MPFQETQSNQSVFAIIQAGSVYCAQLRAMMAPMFCTVNSLTQLNGVKSKFKQIVEQNSAHLDAQVRAQALAIVEEMLAINDDELSARLPFVAKKQGELKSLLQSSIE